MSFENRVISEQEAIIIMERAEAEERKAREHACGKEDAVENEALAFLQDELENMLKEMMVLNGNEPVCTSPAAYERWEARRDLLKKQISVVEEEIAKLDKTFNIEE